MYEYIVAIVLSYLLIKWILNFLQIKRNYGDLYVVVTGCDSGFGRDLVYKLDKHGFNVFATCLTKEGVTHLDKTTSERTQTAIVDITEPNDVSNFVEKVKNSLSNEGALWGVVNNAGIMLPQGPCAILNKNDYLTLLNVNLFGMIEVNRQLIPLLRKSKGRIINTSSVLGRVAMGFAPYTVSKYAVEAYSDCLRRDLYYQGISVHIIEPQHYLTSLLAAHKKDYIQKSYQNLLDRLPTEQCNYYGPDYAERVGDIFERLIVNSSTKTTHEVVDAYFHALTARFPKTRYLVGITVTFGIFLWTCPTWIADMIAAKLSIDSIKPAGVSK